MRRVVVTGLGMVTPLACGVDASWQRILEGESGARRIETFDVSDLACKIACQVPRGDGSDGSFNPDQWMEPKEQRKVDDFIIFAISAATQALADAGWKPTSREEQISTGVMIGAGIGGLTGIAETSIVLKERGPRRVSPFFIPGRLINLGFGLRVDRAWVEGAEPFGRDRVLNRHARDRRCRAASGAGRCGGDGRGRRGVHRSRASAWQASSPAARSPPGSTTRPNVRPVPTTRTGTAS